MLSRSSARSFAAARPVARHTFARGLAKKADPVNDLIKANPMLVQATFQTAEALKVTGSNPKNNHDIDQLAEQYVNVKAATSYTHSAAAQVLSLGDTSSLNREPVRVAITGAAGAIGYSMAFRVAAGMMLGPHQPVILQLIELEPAMKALQGVVMELNDCAFPLVAGIETHSSVEKGFEGTDFALLVGAKPRGPGMERGDLLKDNGKIFVGQGQALNKFANKDVKVVVVGNPANTNCLIAASNAPDISPENFTALTRLDHDRALAQISDKLSCHTTEIKNLCIWGNHSATQYPDISFATVGGKPLKQLINDNKWVNNTFIPNVQQRGKAIIDARGSSSAASAANAAIFHIRDWVAGTNGEWTSMAVPSCSAYGVGEGLYYSYPVVCEDGRYVKQLDLKVDKFSQEKMDATKKELIAERDAVKGFLK